MRITPNFLPHAEGSALIDLGNTSVICALSIEERVPQFLRATGSGWVTAEYGMLPRSTSTRMPRESMAGRPSGRTQEIQRLIGRSLRAVTNLDVIGERQFTIDCDVIRADGGTRTAAITGAYVALYQAFGKLVKAGELSSMPLTAAVAAVSVGIVAGQPILDLCYEEDAGAEVDFNVVMTSNGDFVEVQGTAEGRPFNRGQMEDLLALGHQGIGELLQAQLDAIAKLG